MSLDGGGCRTVDSADRPVLFLSPCGLGALRRPRAERLMGRNHDRDQTNARLKDR